MNDEKQCIICGDIKNIPDDFYVSKTNKKTGKIYYCSYCKSCKSILRKESYKVNRIKEIEGVKKWKKENKERRKIHSANYRNNTLDKDKHRAYMRNYMQNYKRKKGE